jgi:hypothetical protein
MCFAKDHPRASDSLAEDGSVRSDSIDLCFYTPHLDEKVGVVYCFCRRLIAG